MQTNKIRCKVINQGHERQQPDGERTEENNQTVKGWGNRRLDVVESSNHSPPCSLGSTKRSGPQSSCVVVRLSRWLPQVIQAVSRLPYNCAQRRKRGRARRPGRHCGVHECGLGVSRGGRVPEISCTVFPFFEPFHSPISNPADCGTASERVGRARMPRGPRSVAGVRTPFLDGSDFY